MALITTTINNLRTTIIPNGLDIYYTTDIGMEGNWCFDATDTTSVDNTGTAIVSVNGYRFKRVIDNFINVKWFGVKGDAYPSNSTPTNDTLSIQLAIDALQYGIVVVPDLMTSKTCGNLYFPAGYYLVDKLVIKQTGFQNNNGKLNIIGSGIKSTIFVANSQFVEVNYANENTISIPIPIKTIFEVNNPYTTFSELGFIGSYLKPGVYKHRLFEEDTTYLLEGGYESIGIDIKPEVAFINLEKLHIRCCHVGILSTGALLFNINNCHIGGDKGWVPSVTGFDYEYYCDYGIKIDSSMDFASNQITISNSFIVWCRVWGISYSGGQLINILNCDFERNGFCLPSDPNPNFPTTGDENSGAIFIEGMGPSLFNRIINITNSWFEENLGYDLYYGGVSNGGNDSSNITFNIIGSRFFSEVLGINKRHYGLYIKTNPNVDENKIVNLIGTYFNVTKFNNNLSTFQLDVTEYNEIGSNVHNKQITNPPPPLVNFKHYKL